jgi:hypothetical protein
MTGSPSTPLNQCDGCQRRLHLGSNGIHYDHDGSLAHPVMACTKDRYMPSQESRNETFQVSADPERVAQIIAHRACCGTEHDPLNGKLHGYCVVCGVPWPCDYAGKPPTSLPSEKGCTTPPGFVQQLRALKRSLEGEELYGYCDECDRLLAMLGERKSGDRSFDKHDEPKIICHAPGDRCHGCDHYKGKATVCSFAPSHVGAIDEFSGGTCPTCGLRSPDRGVKNG